MSRTQALQLLQEADGRVATLRGELAAAEQSVRRDSALEQATARASAAVREAEQLAQDAAAAESAARDLESRARSLDRRLYGGTVHNPHELMEMQRELEALREQAAAAESAALELMESAEEAAAGSERAQQALQEHRERHEARLPELRERLVLLQEELMAATAERTSIADQLEQADLSLYARVAAHHQPAVAALAGDTCGGCHLPVSIEERRMVRTGAIVQCSNCDRILVP